VPPKVIGLLVLAALAVAFALWQGLGTLGGSEPNAHMPSDFPHAYLAPADNGMIDKVVVWRGRNPPEVVELEGAERFPAFQCTARQCPGAKGGVPFVFAYGHDPRGKSGATTTCPACTAAKRDAHEVSRYRTPEGEAARLKMLKKLDG
jgi:hypothetical protein